MEQDVHRDLICDAIRYGLNNDSINFRKSAEAFALKSEQISMAF